MTVRDEVDRFRAEQQDAVRAVVAVVLERWGRVDPDFIVESWNELLPGVAGQVTAAQLRAAESGARYVPAVARAQGVTSGIAEVNVAAFGGVASDGRPLDTLLATPAAQTLRRIGEGEPAPEALSAGRRSLGLIAGTQVRDMGRMASSVGMTGTRAMTGYRRQLTPPSCSRCAILAGKWFRWNQGFQRHPQCDCVHVPSTGPNSDLAGLETFDPKAYFESLSPEEQARRFTKDGARAIRDGADMGQVVNARRGMRSTRAYGKQIMTTTVGTSTRASAARIMRRHIDAQFTKQGGRYRQINVPRLMPEQIYADATSRDDAIRLLGRFGYLND